MKCLQLPGSVFLALLTLGLAGCDNQPSSDVPTSAAGSPDDGQSGSGVALQRGAPASADPAISLENPDSRASYGIGYRIGSSIIQDENLQVDQAALLAGLKDGLAGRKGRLDETEIQSAGKELEERATAKTTAINDSKLEDARGFLQRNAQRAGVEVTDTGLQYEVLTETSEPEAPMPTATDTVEVHYHGTLVNGTVFDSSIDRGEPISFAVRGVIPGWVEALKLMKVGEKRRLYVPPNLGYGSEGAGSVPPNSVLIFDLELLKIEGQGEDTE
jgi:FKBP-type peptidyl-prolyl cis-trans isomerase FklB